MDDKDVMMQLGILLSSFTRPAIECGRILYDREACYGFFKIGRWQQEGQWDHGTLSSGDQYDRTNEKDHSGGTGVKPSSKSGDTQFVNSSCRGTQTLRINDARIYW